MADKIGSKGGKTIKGGETKARQIAENRQAQRS